MYLNVVYFFSVEVLLVLYVIVDLSKKKKNRAVVVERVLIDFVFSRRRSKSFDSILSILLIFIYFVVFVVDVEYKSFVDLVIFMIFL